jgi:ABC-2 type transport system ATP-binding protein
MSEAPTATVEAASAAQTPAPADAMITVRGLSKSFKIRGPRGAKGASSDLKAVDDVSFDVMRGEVFGFLGPNGAGKSTTIKMLTTLLRPTSGSIRLNGFDPATQADAVRRSIGIVFQDPSLDQDLTAEENMEIHGVLYKVPVALRRERTEQLLKMVELWDRRKDQVSKFSGGMRRRLEIARGLLHRPTVLFLDEPTLGLDPQTRNQMWSYLKDMSATAGTTVFFTTHYMDEADRNAHRLAIVDHGKIVATGTPAEVKAGQQAETLEDAFLKLTGHSIREESMDAAGRTRMMMAAMSRRRG